MLLNTDVVSSEVKMSRCLLSSQKSELVNNRELLYFKVVCELYVKHLESVSKVFVEPHLFFKLCEDRCLLTMWTLCEKRLRL